MYDAKLTNHDVLTERTGKVVTVTGKDALFQRALISASIKKGSFKYNRTLGADFDKTAVESLTAQKVELVVNEALAEYQNTSASVVSVANKITLDITVDGQTERLEVI